MDTTHSDTFQRIWNEKQRKTKDELSRHSEEWHGTKGFKEWSWETNDTQLPERCRPYHKWRNQLRIPSTQQGFDGKRSHIISALIPFVWWLSEDWAIEMRVIFKMCIGFQVSSPPLILSRYNRHSFATMKDVLRVTVLGVSFIENKLMYFEGQRNLQV